jgi:hypothetical protein
MSKSARTHVGEWWGEGRMSGSYIIERCIKNTAKILYKEHWVYRVTMVEVKGLSVVECDWTADA